jgi:hypothetical protein
MTVLMQQLEREINPAISNHAAAGAKMIDDPLLNYFALGLLIFVVVVNSYVIVAILRKLIRKAGRRRERFGIKT